MRNALWGSLALAVILACLTGCAPYRDVTIGHLEDDDFFAEEPPRTPRDDSWDEWDRETPTKIRTTFNSYLRSRWLDFWDMFEVGVSGGRGFRLDAQYLIGSWGYGIADVQRWRIGQRVCILNEETTQFSTLPFPASLILFPAGMSVEQPLGTIITLGGVSYESEHYIWPDPAFNGLPSDKVRVRMACVERDRARRRFIVTAESTAVGVELHALLGARARVMPLQILDFVAGLVFADLLGDDVKPYDPDE